MRSSKSRSRSKQNRPRSIGNIVNRVFDSSGPEGKVRGTPQQIIEKYQALARDAQLSNDRVAAENFSQHAEHYTRMLGEAMRELAAEQEARRHQGGHNGNGNQGQHGSDRQHQNYRRDERVEEDQPEIGDVPVFALEAEEADSGLVDTPEARGELSQPAAAFEPAEPREFTPRERGPREGQGRAPRDARFERPARPERAPRSEGTPRAEQPSGEEDNNRAEDRRPARGPRVERGPRPEQPARAPRAPAAATQPETSGVTVEVTPLAAPVETPDTAGGEASEAPKVHRPRAPRKPAASKSPIEVTE